MGRDVIKESIMEAFRQKTGWKDQAIRVKVSRFKLKKCPRATQNAAAHMLAQTKGFSCARQLSREDKASLPDNIGEIVSGHNTRSREERFSHSRFKSARQVGSSRKRKGGTWRSAVGSFFSNSWVQGVAITILSIVLGIIAHQYGLL